MTVRDLIAELATIPEDRRDLPVVIQSDDDHAEYLGVALIGVAVDDASGRTTAVVIVSTGEREEV